MERATVQTITLPPGRRVLVLSDIHGNRDFFWSLLHALDFSPEDELILLGDLLEKGEESLTLLREVMELTKTHRVHMLCGNCDNLTYNFVDENPDIPLSFYESYIFKWERSVFCARWRTSWAFPSEVPPIFPLCAPPSGGAMGGNWPFCGAFPPSCSPTSFSLSTAGYRGRTAWKS